ncbi:unnamed protein product [Cunninghamella blakesleeana]
MVEIQPTNPKGYLRLGKILTLQQRYSSALNIYRRGHRRVDNADTHYKTILSMEKSIEDKIKKQKIYIKKQTDPVHFFPYDVLDAIFSHLAFHRRVVCTQVSKNWRQFLHHWSGMWKDFDFITGSIKHNAVSKKTLTNYFSYITLGRHLRLFQLSANDTKASFALKLLVDNDCQYLEYLGFADTTLPQNQFSRTLRLMGKNLTHLYLDDCNISLNVIFTEILDICTQITHLYYTNINNTSSFTLLESPQQKKIFKLQHLHLATNINDSTLEYLLQSCPSLTHLILPNINVPIELLFRYPLDQLNVLYYDTLPIATQLPYWKNAYSSTKPIIKQLSLSSKANNKGGLIEFIVKRCHGLTDKQIMYILEKHRTTLQVINLNRSTGFNNKWCSVLKSMTVENEILTFPLRELHLQYCDVLTESDWINILTSCPQLRIIVASFIQQINNNVLEAISQLPHLEYLDISSCTNVNGIGIRNLVDRRKGSLKKLILNHCTSIYPDAIQYAKSQLRERSVVCTFNQK